MKVVGIKQYSESQQTKVMDCCVERGYIKTSRGSLPDVDLDFDAARRPEVKAHLEEKYNNGKSQRVFAAGTFY